MKNAKITFGKRVTVIAMAATMLLSSFSSVAYAAEESLPTAAAEQTAEPDATAEPEPAETPEPTEAPAEAAAETVTETPTEAPTAEPTPEPAETPEVTATAEPTPEATAEPETTAAEPTEIPEATATAEPTELPEATATAEPTEAPEATATAEPTEAPEAAATPEPTEAPQAVEVPVTLQIIKPIWLAPDSGDEKDWIYPANSRFYMALADDTGMPVSDVIVLDTIDGEAMGKITLNSGVAPNTEGLQPVILTLKDGCEYTAEFSLDAYNVFTEETIVDGFYRLSYTAQDGGYAAELQIATATRLETTGVDLYSAGAHTVQATMQCLGEDGTPVTDADFNEQGVLYTVMLGADGSAISEVAPLDFSAGTAEASLAWKAEAAGSVVLLALNDGAEYAAEYNPESYTVINGGDVLFDLYDVEISTTGEATAITITPGEYVMELDGGAGITFNLEFKDGAGNAVTDVQEELYAFITCPADQSARYTAALSATEPVTVTQIYDQNGNNIHDMNNGTYNVVIAGKKTADQVITDTTRYEANNFVTYSNGSMISGSYRISGIENTVEYDGTGNTISIIAEGQGTTPYTYSQIANALGVATNFGVFANTFNQSVHLEATIAANTATGLSDFGLSGNNYNNVEYSITATKTYKTEDGKPKAGESVTLRLYYNVGGADVKYAEATVTTDANGTAAYKFDKLPEGAYTLYEVIDGQEIKTNGTITKADGTKVTVSYGAQSATIVDNGYTNYNYINNVVGGLGNALQSPGVLVLGNSYDTFKDFKDEGTYIVQAGTEGYPVIDFGTTLASAAEMSAKLATAKDSSDVKVYYLTADEIAKSEINFVSDGKEYILINVDATGKDAVGIGGRNKRDGVLMNADFTNRDATKVIYNFYTITDGIASAYTGKVNMNDTTSGTILAPAATVEGSNGNHGGTVIAETYNHTTGEIHQLKDVEDQKENVSVGNTEGENAPSYVDLSGTKQWVNDTEADRKEPVLTLYLKIGTAEPTEVKDAAPTWTKTGNAWKYTYTNLQDGDGYVYYVVETQLDGYDAPSYTNIAPNAGKNDGAYNGGTITNTKTEKEKISVSGSKTWKDDNNTARPESITINLLANGVKKDSKNVTADDGWKWSFTGLDKYDADGEVIEYTITEEKVDGYESKVNGYNVTNTRTGTTEVNGSKTWNDADDTEGRPTSITINLLANGEKVNSQEVTAADDWAWNFTGLDKYDADGEVINYTITEEKVDGYESKVNGYNVTNTRTGKTEVSGSKTWNDADDTTGRPESITINLLANGVKKDSKTVTAADDWAWNFTDLDKYDADGEVITYTITEEKVDGYKGVVSGYDVTNTRTGTTEVSGSKTWNDDGDTTGRPEKIVIHVWNGQTEVAQKEVTAADGWEWNFTDIDKYDADGKAITYTITEDAVPGYTGDVNGYDVTNTRTGKTEVSGSKTWNDAGDTTSRPEKIVIHVWNGQTEVAQKEVTAADGWKWSFADLEKYDADGKEIEYTITEDTVPGYTSEVIGYNVTNTRIKAAAGEIKATKHYSGESEGSIEFALELHKSDADGAVGDLLETQTVTVSSASGADTAVFSEIEYTAEGDYYYVILENQQTGAYAGLSMDPSSYLVKVSVTADPATGALTVAEPEYTWMFEDMRESTGEAAFYNNEVRLRTMNSALLAVQGRKQLVDGSGSAQALKAGQFRFNLSTDAAGESIVATATNEADGSFTLLMSMPAGGTAAKTYYLREQNAGKTIDGVVYSDAVYRVVIEGAEVSYPDGEPVFTNTAAAELTVTKVWQDDGYTDARPASVTVNLYANGDTANAVDTVELSGQNGWTHTFTGLSAANVYTVAETPVEGYTAQITQGEDGYSFVITNSYNAAANATYTPGINKVLEGRTGIALADGEFSFSLKDETGAVLDTAYNKADGTVTFNALRYTEAGTYTYTIAENAGTDGHIVYDDTVITLTVTVSEQDGKLTAAASYAGGSGEGQNTLTNLYRSIVLRVRKTSRDGSGDPLAGATYGLWMVNDNGNDAYIGNAVSDANGYMTFNTLVPGARYYFKEEAAPNGHTVDEYPSRVFRIIQVDGKYAIAYEGESGFDLDMDTANAATGADAQGSDIVELTVEDVSDEVTKLGISKLDKTTGEYVTGATLQIIEKATGTVVYQWVTGSGITNIDRVLNVNTVYILRETAAPENYNLAADTEFSFDEYGILTIRTGSDAEWVSDTALNLYDTRIPGVITKTETKPEIIERVKEKPVVRQIVQYISSPQTGDGAPLLLVGMLLIAGVLLIIYLQQRKRYNNDR